jgi:hypothetical protein
MKERKAVIDRIEDGAWAVLLVGRKQVEKIVPVEQLPKDAKEGTRVKLRLDKDVVKDIMVDAEGTAAAQRRIASKMKLLRSRSRRLKRVDASAKEPAEPDAPDDPQSKTD